MGMRALSAFFLLSILSFAYIADARKDGGNYWKSKMKGEPMPKAIQDLFNQNTSSEMRTTDRFVRNFEAKRTFIVYHSPTGVHPDEP
ncbi:hypothetical protein F511_07061 [Dorcoceras hygrometricum]|uniref:Organ-specific protein P4-like n=1 Tax=Dorcoceras hygrometricum TaxID=472368 RepID=A0A2Z7D5X0_9LAMI|nr:hypothetical protein F511_07061 [Dorcoceras hygrometricum]